MRQIDEKDIDKDGKCKTCGRIIKIYRYHLNSRMARFLRAMAKENTKGAIDISKLDLPYSVRTQVTKMRLHGLIARHKVEGKQVARHWLITHKGWGWLGGVDIEKTVVVYNNQVIGHEGPSITIQRADPQPLHDEEAISEPEAKTYANVRQRVAMRVRAIFRGRSWGKLVKGDSYELDIKTLTVGKPVELSEPIEISYKDIAAFHKDWQVQGRI